MSELRRTPLYDAHRALGARMVEFGGWSMPVQYPTGILAEHRAVRERVGLFDVSHMGELELEGPQSAEALGKIVTRDVRSLAQGGALYTVVCLPSGGIVDDLIVYRLAPERFLIVVNASNIEKDYAWFRENVGEAARVRNLSDQYGLLALQGPGAAGLLQPLWNGPPLVGLASFTIATGKIEGVAVLASRTGYTGEDGFELFVPPDQTPRVWDALLQAGATPCGLGARDTLRLEARLCLYGHELDENTTPLEAGLEWVVSWNGTEFIGKQALLAQRAAGPPRKLVGFVMQERGIARAGYRILDGGGTHVGTVTSGAPSPTTGQAIGLGYIPTALAREGEMLVIDCRGKPLRARIHRGAFYKRGKP